MYPNLFCICFIKKKLFPPTSNLGIKDEEKLPYTDHKQGQNLLLITRVWFWPFIFFSLGQTHIWETEIRDVVRK